MSKISKASLGFQLKDIKSIIISHTHVDHLGELKHLVDLNHAKVYAHELEVPYLLKKAIPEKDPRYYEATKVKVSRYDFDTLVLYHGEPIIGGAGARLREFIEYLKGISNIFQDSIRDALSGN